MKVYKNGATGLFLYSCEVGGAVIFSKLSSTFSTHFEPLPKSGLIRQDTSTGSMHFLRLGVLATELGVRTVELVLERMSC